MLAALWVNGRPQLHHLLDQRVLPICTVISTRLDRGFSDFPSKYVY